MADVKDVKDTCAPRSNRRDKQVYTYDAKWDIYALNWSNRAGDEYAFRFAIGSFIEEYRNKIKIIQLNTDEAGPEFFELAEFDHPYPATKVMWHPPKNMKRDLLATTGDYLRLWSVRDKEVVKLEGVFSNSKNSEYCSPITSFDWNETDPTLLGTASIDTTCTMWDIETQKVKTQLIAHDKEVFDIAFATGKNIFATVGADGSIRMFDLRSLSHSTIIYETPGLKPLLRLSWNLLDTYYVAAMVMDSPVTVVVDTRMPSKALHELKGHSAAVNGVNWAPHSPQHLCTIGDDCQTLIWDIAEKPGPEGAEVNQVRWSAANPDFITIAFNNKMQLLRV